MEPNKDYEAGVSAALNVVKGEIDKLHSELKSGRYMLTPSQRDQIHNKIKVMKQLYMLIEKV